MAKRLYQILPGIFFIAATCSCFAQSSPGLKWSTNFEVESVNTQLSTPQEREEILQFLRRLHISKVYLEVRDWSVKSDPATLRADRDFFRNAGIAASGMVATYKMPKRSTRHKVVACFTNRANQEYVKKTFQDAASIFNEIIIDDWLFTDCECSECAAAKGSLSWQQYRKKLMLQISRNDILGPARKVNPDVRIILKYPNWYDRFEDWGYEVSAETALYDRIWVGTEVRDPSSRHHVQQYAAFFLYRWLDGIGGKKTGSAWFDPYETKPILYLDQAYVSVLAGAPEILLYGAEEFKDGSAKYQPELEALITRQSNLEALAKLVGNWQGIPAYKPPSSRPGKEPHIFDQVGMLGIPLLPISTFPKSAKAAFFSDYSLSDTQFIPELIQYFDRGGTAFVSQDLAHRLNEDPRLFVATGLNLDKGEYLKTVQQGHGKMIIFSDELLPLTVVYSPPRVEQPNPALQAALLALRQAAVKYSPLSLDAPVRVAVFPMGRRIAVMNFTEHSVDCHVSGRDKKSIRLHQLLATPKAALDPDQVTLHLPPHGMLMMETGSTRAQ